MIPRELASFLQEGLGIYVATRNASLEPNGAHGVAALVDDAGAHLTVFVPAVAAARLLPDLQANGQVAVSFGRPTDNRACQVKGTVIDTRDARDDERSVVDAQCDGYVRSIENIGISRAVTREWTRWPTVAITLKATAVFNQSPGPSAGTAIS
jgi:hypothetical protein